MSCASAWYLACPTTYNKYPLSSIPSYMMCSSIADSCVSFLRRLKSFLDGHPLIFGNFLSFALSHAAVCVYLADVAFVIVGMEPGISI